MWHRLLRWGVVAAAVTVASGIGATPPHPVMPELYSALVHYNDSDGPQVYRHYFDWRHFREAQVRRTTG